MSNNKYNLGNEYKPENLELLKEILRNGTPEQKEFVWNEIKKSCPDTSHASEHKCSSCKTNNELIKWAWELSKKDEWTVDFTCEVCKTFWTFFFQKIKDNKIKHGKA